MKRNEFLSALGISAGTVLFAPFLVSCNKNSAALGSGAPVDFTLDLTSPANIALNNDGGYIYKNGVIVARAFSTSYIAVSDVCTHQKSTVYFHGGTNRFICPLHGANFASNGSVLLGPATIPLTQYKTLLTGTSLRIYS